MRARFPFGSVFLAGLIAGILIMNFGKSILLENTGLLDEYTLYYMKYMTVDSGALFAYVLRKRMGNALLLVIMATTYLGLVFCAGAAFWYGLSAGAFLAAGVLRFGIKGILLALAGTMPQYLLYLPAFYALFLWCEELYRKIYRKKYYEPDYGKDKETPTLAGRVLKLLSIGIVLSVGCALESFANPSILLSFLKIL